MWASVCATIDNQRGLTLLLFVVVDIAVALSLVRRCYAGAAPLIGIIFFGFGFHHRLDTW